MRVTLWLLLFTAPAHALLQEDCCDDPTEECCDPIPPPSVLPPLPLPPPTRPPPRVVVVPGVIVAPAPILVRLPPKKDDGRILARLSLGGAYLRMLDINAGGASIDLMLGMTSSVWGGGFKLGLVAGQDHGLTFTWLRIGGGFEWNLGERVHFGLGMQLGMLAIERAHDTVQRDWMASPTIGAHLELGVDLRRARPSGWFVFSRLGGDFVMAVTNLSPATLLLAGGLGYRL